MLNSEQRRQYVRWVCRALWDKEPADLRMSVAEFGVLQQWMDDQTPLRVVLQAIGQVKERPDFAQVKHRIRYVAPAVEEELRRVAQANPPVHAEEE